MSDEGAADVYDTRADLRRVEDLKLLAARAARLAERRRMIRNGAWVAAFIVIVGLADAWVHNKWIWFVVVVSSAYISLRLLHWREGIATVLTKPNRTAVIVTGAVTFAILVPLRVLVIDRFVSNGLGAVAVTAAAAFCMWTLSAWWTTR